MEARLERSTKEAKHLIEKKKKHKSDCYEGLETYKELVAKA